MIREGMTLKSAADISLLKETVELECKLAQGRAGKGQIPEDFWRTYSAFGNSGGGTILLGVRETSSGFEIAGVENTSQMRTDLFNLALNKQKVSECLIIDSDVNIHSIGGKSIISVTIPIAGRKKRPVYINNNPLTGSYRRVNDGDRALDAESVHRMLAERTEDSRDNRVLPRFWLDDLSRDTVRTFRQALRDARPEHVYLDADDDDFLRLIGAWRVDRDTGARGLTVAGLLMFGRGEAITDEFPNYALDYQERPLPKTEARWNDRVTIDGTWSGNVFDFYRLVYRKIISDLKVPFMLADGRRQGETTLHQALREAFVNTLVHADYSGRASVLIVKRPDMFGFRNPGLMRITVEQAIEGGESDGRNRTLQQMFLLVGAGERAGSGVPKIFKGWADQHWVAPSLYETSSPSDQTRLELRTSDLVPRQAIDYLKGLFGERFDTLSADQRLALATAHSEGTVTHGRMSTMCGLHSVDITRMLQGLVHDDMLVQVGRGRGSAYHLPGANSLSPDTVFGPTAGGAMTSPTGGDDRPTLKGDLPSLVGDLTGLVGDLGSLKGDLGTLQGDLPTLNEGRIVEGLEKPLIDDLKAVQPSIGRRLRLKSIVASFTQRMPPSAMRNIVIDICQDHYLTIKVIAELLGRGEKYLRDIIINPMVEEGLIKRAFPHTPNDPRQAYTMAAKLEE